MRWLGNHVLLTLLTKTTMELGPIKLWINKMSLKRKKERKQTNYQIEDIHFALIIIILCGCPLPTNMCVISPSITYLHVCNVAVHYLPTCV